MDTYVGKCKICHNEGDCINGVCSNCEATRELSLKYKGDIGQKVMEFIINCGLVWVSPDVVKYEYSGGLMIWSPNAAEQLTQFIAEIKKAQEAKWSDLSQAIENLRRETRIMWLRTEYEKQIADLTAKLASFENTNHQISKELIHKNHETALLTAENERLKKGKSDNYYNELQRLAAIEKAKEG